MKTILIAFGIVATFASCKKDNAGNLVFYKSCKNYNVQNKNLQVCFNEVIQDSRCPYNVMCITQGAFVANFTFTVNGQAHRFDMRADAYLPLNIPSDTTVSGIRVKLLSVRPGAPVGDKNQYALEFIVQ